MARHGDRFASVPSLGTPRLIHFLAPVWALWLLLCSVASCGSDGSMNGSSGPLVRLHVSPVDAGVTQAILSATAQDPTGQDKQNSVTFSSGPFNLLGVSYPLGTRGSTTYQVKLYGDASCLLASGTASLTIDSDGVFDVSVTTTATPLCGNGATLTVQVSKVSNGAGTITSTTPTGISCQGVGAGCTLTLMKGAQVTLAAQAQAGSSFAGWSGGGCSGTGGCSFTITDDVQVQGIFTTCRGWCQEPFPFPVTANLNAVSGTAANNVYVVGDSGTVLKWDGTTWLQITPPPAAATVNFRAAAIRAVPNILNVAGDGGTILQLSASGNWKAIANTTITGSIRGIAIGGNASTPDTHFVGDSMNALILSNNSSSVSSKGVGGSGTLYAISQVLGTTSDDLLIGGAMTGGKGYAVRWDGNNSTTQNMASGTSLPGDIYAMLCANSYFYAAGAGGAIVRRSSASGNENSWMAATSPTTSNLRGLWAAVDTFIVAVGDGGTILQFDGTSWTKVPNSPTSTNLHAIWGASPVNIYAVGDNGTLLHYLP